MSFRDRAEAGRRLGERLLHLLGEDVVILGLPRGGVPVAFEVARALGAPLDVIVVRKLGVPFQPELAMGAIGEGGVRIVNEEVTGAAGVSEAEFAAVEERERAELERRAVRFRAERPRVSLEGRTVVVVDDGIATGSTARAACEVARAQGASRVLLAVPVAPSSSIEMLAGCADEVACLETPEFFFAVGQFYRDFSETTDAEVVELLERAVQGSSSNPALARAEPAAVDPPVRDEEVEVRAGLLRLAGHLTVPEVTRGGVVFAHGSGSSRHSPRNRLVAAILNDAGFATLLFDLLTIDEELDRANVFDIELLASRLADVTRWLRTQPEAQNLPVGYFGASTGAGAALWAAAESENDVSAVVSRGGRPDLAEARLAEVRSPTLLIVGSLDDSVLELNRQAQALLRCESELSVVPGATHLFEEPGTLEAAAGLARDWFTRHLQTPQRSGAL
jgi:putative phosphoribosyl transferase